MSEAPRTQTKQFTRPPMDAAECRLIVRSQIGRVVFGLCWAALAGWLSWSDRFPFGLVPTAAIGLGFGYAIGGKFFPDSSDMFRRRFKNYFRLKKGLPPLDEGDDSHVQYNNDFRTG